MQEIIDKEAIRELVLLYSRAIDRIDLELLRDLYTEDATDTHGDTYAGPIQGFLAFLEKALPSMRYTGHHACNHLISVDGDKAFGEVYCIAAHCMPGRDNPDQLVEDIMFVRYFDAYRRCSDGKWRFADRVVTYDMRVMRPFNGAGTLDTLKPDPSYGVCADRLFQRGPRA